MSTSAKIHEYNSFGVPCSTHPVSTFSRASKGERKPAKISVRQGCQFDDLAILLSLVVNVFELLPEYEKKQGISTDFSDSEFSSTSSPWCDRLGPSRAGRFQLLRLHSAEFATFASV